MLILMPVFQVKCEAEAKEMLAQNQEAGAICKKYCESLGTEVILESQNFFDLRRMQSINNLKMVLEY